jgi:2-iminobutanoate/2-iminopropanoate deaminase
MKERVQTDNAPAAIGPYSQAIRLRNLVFTAGQVGLDPATGELVEGGVGAQAARAIQNLAGVLEAAGTSLASVVKTTVFLTTMSDFAELNEVYAGFFSEGDPPARSTVAVAGLPRGAMVEIECIAMVDAREEPPSASGGHSLLRRWNREDLED